MQMRLKQRHLKTFRQCPKISLDDGLMDSWLLDVGVTANSFFSLMDGWIDGGHAGWIDKMGSLVT